MEPAPKNLRLASFTAHAARGLIRERRARRKLMFAAVLMAVILAITGTTFLEPALNPHEHPLWFILFWFACAWLTVLALLLALFDALIVRAQARAARKSLHGEFSKSSGPGSPSSLDRQ